MRNLRLQSAAFQNAWVVDDLEAACTAWVKQLGVGPFFITDYAPGAFHSVTYLGAPSELAMRIGIAQAGPLQIELIQPITEPSAYRMSVPAGSGQEFVKVEIIGQSFIYNQIRKIVGAAVGFSVGKFSRDYLLASLLSEPSPFHLFLPMAPASGLVLTSATFKHTNNLLVTDDQARDVLGIEPDEKDFIQRPVRSILQEEEHIPRMNSFFSENIFPQIVSEMDETTEIWGNELSRDIMEKSNIESMILDTTKENEQSTHPEKTGRNGLPTGLSTSLSIQYDVLPGMYILDACKALQHELSTGQLVLEASEVDKTGFIVKHIGKGRGNLHEKALTGRMLRKNK